VLPLLLVLPLALAFERWPLDFWAVDRLHLYDPVRAIWIGGSTWWAKGLIHEGGSRLIMVVGLFGFALYAASMQLNRLRVWRRPALFVGLSVLSCTLLIALVKHYSNADCPEDLLRYGGERAYVHIFADKPADAPRGACFPGGHSSGAFSLMAFYFLLRDRSSRRALAALAAALLLGGIYAAGQWSRGEHFPSHDVWSALLCWYVILALYAIAFRGNIWTEDKLASSEIGSTKVVARDETPTRPGRLQIPLHVRPGTSCRPAIR
jgi:membrane-associated PAP2 superfamily phosphatase